MDCFDLIRNEAGDVLGVTAIDQETGNIAVFQVESDFICYGVVQVVFTVHQPMLISTLVTVLVWLLVQVFHYKIWNSGNFHPTGVAGRAYC